MTIKEIRRMTGLSMAKFGELFGISVDNISNWEKGYHSCPSYVVDLLEFRVKNDPSVPKVHVDRDGFIIGSQKKYY